MMKHKMNSQKGCAVVIVLNTVETSEPIDKYKESKKRVGIKIPTRM